MQIFIAKIEWYDPDEGIQVDTLLVPASTFTGAMNELVDYYNDTICCVHYLEPWDGPLHIDDDFMRDIERVRNDE